MFSLFRSYFTLALLLFMVGTTCRADLVTVLNDDEELFFWEGPHEYAIDSGQNWTINEVPNVQFTLLAKGGFVPYQPGQAHWYKIKLTNGRQRNWLLEFADAHISNVELYKQLETSEFKKFPISGFIHPVNGRALKHKNHIFPLYLAKGETATYYARITSRYPSSTMYHLRSLDNNFDYAVTEYYYLGVFYGMLIFIAIYSLLMYSSTGTSLYFYYILYLLGCIAFTLGEDSVGAHLFWPNSTFLNPIFFRYGPLCWFIGFFAFANAFLSLRKSSPLSFYLLIGCIIATTCDIVFGLGGHYWPMLVAVGIALWHGYKKWRNGIRYSRFFVIGYLLVFIGLLFYALRISSFIRTTTFTYYMTYYSFIVESLVFAFAMSDRIRQIRKEKEKAQQEVIDQLQINEELKDKVNRELEAKVSERTTQLRTKSDELTAANDKLEQLSQELQSMNAAMDKENWQLQRLVKETKRQKIEQKSLNFEDFKEVYPDTITCLKFLATHKWPEQYQCKKCGNDKFMKGEKHHSRKCTKCKYDESPTTNTLFQGVRFDLEKAFFIAYHTIESKEKLTMDQLSEVLDLRRNTCWAFKKKVEEKIEGEKYTNWLDVVF